MDAKWRKIEFYAQLLLTIVVIGVSVVVVGVPLGLI